MEIKIDTKHDSPEDIKKAIEFLRRMVGGEADNREIGASGEVSSGMSAMFGDTPIMNSIPDGPEGKSDDDSSEEEEKEEIKIIPY